MDFISNPLIAQVLYTPPSPKSLQVNCRLTHPTLFPIHPSSSSLNPILVHYRPHISTVQAEWCACTLSPPLCTGKHYSRRRRGGFSALRSAVLCVPEAAEERCRMPKKVLLVACGNQDTLHKLQAFQNLIPGTWIKFPANQGWLGGMNVLSSCQTQPCPCKCDTPNSTLFCQGHLLH